MKFKIYDHANGVMYMDAENILYIFQLICWKDGMNIEI